MLWVLVGVWLTPTIGLLVNSFRTRDGTAHQRLVERLLGDLGGLTLDNYRTVLGTSINGGMKQALTNSMAIALPATIIPIGIAAFAAYAFAWIDFRGRQNLFIATVALLAIPLQVALVPLLQLYTGGAHWTIPWLDKTITVFPDLDLTGSTTAVWLSHTAFGLPFAIFLLHNYISSLPRDLFEAARVDGADHFKIFWRLVLPLSVPVIAAFAIFQFLWTWNDYLVAVVMINVNRDAFPTHGHDRQPGRRVRPVRAPACRPGRSSRRRCRSSCSSCSSASSSAASSPAASRADPKRLCQRARPPRSCWLTQTGSADAFSGLGVEEVHVFGGHGDFDLVVGGLYA